MNKLLIICGPTASGKTSLAVSLAKQYSGELISADSRQVYIGMDIGTGKDIGSLQGIPIHLYDVASPTESFSVSRYRQLAVEALQTIQKKGKLPVVVGGTGLYIDSLLRSSSTYDIPPNTQVRSAYQSYSVGQLQNELMSLAPEILSTMNNSDRNNPRRLIRKIEIAQAGILPTNTVLTGNSEILILGLRSELNTIQRSISLRVDERIHEGFLHEIQSLLAQGVTWDMPSMSGLGYAQMKGVLEGTKKLSDAIEEWKTKEFQYAKRQLTWFKKNPRIHWFDPSQPDYLGNVEARVSAWYTSRES